MSSRPAGTLPVASWTGRDRGLALLAVAYFAAVARGFPDADLRASAEAVADGRLWLLLTSALDGQGDAPLLQVSAAAAVAALVVAREGPLAWWASALAGHVGSALLAYAAIGAAVALGSSGAERVAGRPDFGVSCVLGGGVGALLVSGVVSLRRDRAAPRDGGARTGPARGDVLATAVGVAGALVLLPGSLGWYGVEHPLSIALGAAAAWPLARARRAPRARG